MSQTTQHGTAVESAGVLNSDPIEAMASYDGPADQFMSRLLEAACLSSRSQQAALLLADEQGGWSCRVCHPGVIEQHRDRGEWIQHVQRAVELEPPKDCCRLPLFQGPGQQALSQVVIAPLRATEGSAARGLLCLLVERGEEAAGLVAIRHIERAAQVVVRFELNQLLRQREFELVAMTQSMRVMDAVNRETRFRPAGIALCNQVAEAWQASRVSVGFLAGQYVKVRAMSHTEDVNRKMQLVQDLESAMEECVDQDSEVLTPQPETATTINRESRRYADKHGPTRVCVLPLRLDKHVAGAMAVEWPNDHEITPSEIESLRLTANLFTARLHQFYLSDQWLGARAARSIRQGAAVMVGPKHTWAKLTAIAVLAFIAFTLFVKGNDTVDSAFTVQTTQRQIITAPYAGTLLRVGEGVEVDAMIAGSDENSGKSPTTLAVMDASELRVERAALEAELADYRAQADAASGEGDLSAVEVAMANVSRIEAQAKLLDYRIERSVLISPMSGVVLEGDLKQRINGALEKGEVLFEIAPLESLRAELLVPANRIGDLRSSRSHPDNPSRGELASASHPGDFVGFEVERIEPEAEVVDGQNVFRVRIQLDRVTDWLRPGVEGEARVHVAKRSYAYLWTRDAVNWVRMKLWL
ncbi:MAG: HlyD family efflux transporter periplasmic adaptor subunit [Phycisphaeraceae bacterium]|nr:HlyD family efflux transporter periplasmic adaptor subunit [Phycisphaeraceae bacterium]